MFGYFGIFINRRNILFFLVYLELIYNGIMLMFLFAGHYLFDVDAIVYFLVCMCLVAGESIIGLVLSVLQQRSSSTLDFLNLTSLHG